MAMNEPTWREEVELRFQLENQRNEARFAQENQRTEARFERILSEVKEEFRKVDLAFREMDARMESRFKLLDKDINWLKIIIGTLILPLTFAIISIVFPRYLGH